MTKLTAEQREASRKIRSEFYDASKALDYALIKQLQKKYRAPPKPEANLASGNRMA